MAPPTPDSGRSILDHPIITERYFFPRPDRPDAATVSVPTTAAVLECVHVRAAGPESKTVLFFHGNGEVVADYHPWFVRTLQDRGHGVMLAEYRGYGGSTGQPCLVDMLGDVEPIFAALGQPEHQVIVFGRSVGSTYALETVARHPGVAGLILESGIADPLERILLRVSPEELGTTRSELAAAVQQHLDPQRKLARLQAPLLVLHAKHDSLVDATHGRRLASWGDPASTELVLLSEGDHNSVMMMNYHRYWEAVDRFVARL